MPTALAHDCFPVHSWFRNEAHTYPLAVIPRTEIRMETRNIDGTETEVKIRVQVIPEKRRLFEFDEWASELTFPEHTIDLWC